ncbi:MAG: Fic family protein, partial [Sulfurisoma sp.]|nr:Fic family protein [Sulfurisoma sp.]
MADLIEVIGQFPQGVSATELEHRFEFSRATLNRRLREGVERGALIIQGKGPATRYLSADPLAAIRAYFEQPHTSRKIARFREELLEPQAGLRESVLSSLGNMPRYAHDKRELSRFLIDFSCASSILEGGTYSLLDTQALIEYGEKSPGKPLEDAFLVLNHKEAFEALHNDLRLESIFKVHDLLTNDHDLPALSDSRHFLSKPFRGVPREYEDVDIALSAYQPPFRPGTGYIAKALDRVLERASALDNPVQAAFYLLTRIPYLQPFRDGNKRTSRAICNVPLLNAHLPPISFVDFGKRD